MNERIKELAAKAGIYGAVDINGNYDNEEEVKKFAELIVRECMAQCYKVEADDEFSGISVDALLCREEIRKHFGVK
jgi:hypothetical protein